MYEIAEREVPAVRVATEQTRVRAADLPDWIDAACGRLAAAAAGAVTGPMFVLYHGEVTEESDGPAEVCLTVAADAQIAGASTRIVPAHTEAFTRITKAQVVYPQILGAYRAVQSWVRASGREPAGPPRELYFVDFGAAGPDDEVCDIAWPTS